MHAPGLHGPDEGRAGLGRPVGRIACGWADGGHPFHGPTRQTFEPGSTSHGAALAYERVPGIREEIQGLFVDPRFTTGHGEIGLGAIRHQIEKQLVVTCQGPDQVILFAKRNLKNIRDLAVEIEARHPCASFLTT